MRGRVATFAFLFLCTMSHALLDALTDGGLGVAFFSPFSNERYFFPWTPIRVSRFFSARADAADVAGRTREALRDHARSRRPPPPLRAYRAVDTGTPHAVAFLRGDDVLVVVPRLTTSLDFGDHALNVPGRWRNVFTEETLDSLELRNVFASFPVAILEREV